MTMTSDELYGKALTVLGELVEVAKVQKPMKAPVCACCDEKLKSHQIVASWDVMTNADHCPVERAMWILAHRQEQP